MKKALLLSMMLFITGLAFSQLAEGTEVKSKWGGYWHKGTIIKVKNDKYLVHYTGYGPGYDQWLDAGDMEKVEYKSKSKSSPSKNAVAKKVTPAPPPLPSSDTTLVAAPSINSTVSVTQEKKVETKPVRSAWRRKDNTTVKKEAEVVAEVAPPVSKKEIAAAPVSEVKKQEEPVYAEKREVKSNTETKTNSLSASHGNATGSNSTQVKNVAYDNKPAWNPSPASGKRMINADRVGDKLYLYYTVRGNALDISYLYLGKETIVRNPKYGVNPVMLDQENKNNIANSGTYLIDGEKMMINWADGRSENWKVAYSTMVIYGINGQTVAAQKTMPPGYTLNGRFAVNGLTKNNTALNIDFNYKGTFVARPNTIAQLASNTNVAPNQKGQYSIVGNTLTLKFESGESVSAVICLPVINGKKYLVLNNSSYLLQ